MEPDPVLSSSPTLSIKRFSKCVRSLQSHRVTDQVSAELQRHHRELTSLSRSRRTLSSERMWLLLSLLPDTGDAATIHHPASASAVAAVRFPNTSGPSHLGTTYCSDKPHQIAELSVSEKKMEAYHQERTLEKRENIQFMWCANFRALHPHLHALIPLISTWLLFISLQMWFWLTDEAADQENSCVLWFGLWHHCNMM